MQSFNTIDRSLNAEIRQHRLSSHLINQYTKDNLAAARKTAEANKSGKTVLYTKATGSTTRFTVSAKCSTPTTSTTKAPGSITKYLGLANTNPAQAGYIKATGNRINQTGSVNRYGQISRVTKEDTKEGSKMGMGK